MNSGTTLKPYQRRVFVVDITDGDKIVEEIIDIRKPWSGFVLLSTIIRNPDQPRQLFDLDDLVLLAGSLKTTLQVSPITAVVYETSENPQVLWMINDGERRLRALQINGKIFLWVAYNPLITVKNLFQASTIANLCRKGHTYMENARAIENLMRIFKTNDYAIIAAQMGFTQGWIKQLHSLTKLHPILQIILDPPTPQKNRIPMDAALALSSVEQDRQLEIWDTVKHASKRQISVLVRSLSGSEKSVTGRPHRATDDARIAKGKFKSIKRTVQVALELPDLIFGKIEDKDKPDLIKTLDEVRTLLRQLEAKIETEEVLVPSPGPTKEQPKPRSPVMPVARQPVKPTAPQQAPKPIPAHPQNGSNGNTSTTIPTGPLSSDQIIANVRKGTEQAAARARLVGHRGTVITKSTIADLQEGTGFTKSDFRDDGDYAHGAGG